ncbi:hypothetical protein [Streptomyces sp. NPDC020681]|uniref:hypothetical protein n=1 Tax=Streptomyces sp. NPDC020681 TaxID=3365083 RepID=UPI0037B46CFD
MTVSVVLAVVIGVLLLGAIGALIRESRGAPPQGRAPRRVVGPDVTGRDALEAVDLALRALAVGCARAGRELPDVYVLDCSADRITLRLTRADTDPPRPWDVDESGEEWSISRKRPTGGEDVAGQIQPFPLTVTLGLHDGSRMLVDLARAGAPVALTGATADVHRLAGAFVGELVTGPVGRGTEVTLIGSVAAELAGLSGMSSGRLHTAATLDEALARGTDTAAIGSNRSASVTQIYGLIEGGGSDDAEWRAPRLLVVDADRFREDMWAGGAPAGLRRSDAMVVLGDVPDAAWRLAVGVDGGLDTGALGLEIDKEAGRLG